MQPIRINLQCSTDGSFPPEYSLTAGRGSGRYLFPMWELPSHALFVSQGYLTQLQLSNCPLPLHLCVCLCLCFSASASLAIYESRLLCSVSGCYYICYFLFHCHCLCLCRCFCHCHCHCVSLAWLALLCHCHSVCIAASDVVWLYRSTSVAGC